MLVNESVNVRAFWTEGRQTEGQTDRLPPCSTGLHPLWGRCPASPGSNSESFKAGQQGIADHILPLGNLYLFVLCQGGITWEKINGSFYSLHSNSVTWRHAQEFCLRRGAWLAVIEDPSEETALRNLVRNSVSNEGLGWQL